MIQTRLHMHVQCSKSASLVLPKRAAHNCPEILSPQRLSAAAKVVEDFHDLAYLAGTRLSPEVVSLVRDAGPGPLARAAVHAWTHQPQRRNASRLRF